MAIKDVKDSYGRCCVNPKFFGLFYETFLASHPAIAPMFAKTDMSKQKSLLRQGLSMMLMHLEGNTVGTTGMDRIAESHSKKKMNIQPHLYDYWITSLLKCVKECDPQITPQLEGEWKQSLQQGVRRIVAGYDK